MAVISNSDLDDLAGLGADLALKDDCEILQESGTETTTGGHTSTWTPVETVKCAVLFDNAPREKAITAEQVMQQKMANKILLPRGTAATIKNRLRANGMLYTITGVPDPTSYEIFRTVFVLQAQVQDG